MEIIQALQKNHRQLPQRSSLQRALTTEEMLSFNRMLLGWVRFAEMETRYEKIARAHKQTFGWVFRPPPDDRWSCLTDWLENKTEGLYWITGKPAAGKSTLMKYIIEDPLTVAHLKKWAGTKKVVTSTFCFWNSGTQMQMSEDGMLRTLLYTALRHAPELWTILFPSKLEEYLLFWDSCSLPITSDEVHRAFRLLVDSAGTDYCLFFFIDGLDEFGGAHDRLVTMIQGLLSPHVKTCVSSRAWPVFEDGFQCRPSLRVETLTYEDIKHYVTSRFANSPGYRERRLEIPVEIDKLIDNITLKASGVFLWVQLVTDSLLKGLAEGDRFEELQERLEAVPADLEALFWKMLADVDTSHRGHSSQLLQIMRASRDTLTVLDFSYGDDSDPNLLHNAPFGPLDPQQAEGRACRMRRRLKVCCKGLLEAEALYRQPVAFAKVTYLHRTVRDYVERPEIWLPLLQMTDISFNLAHRMYNIHAIRIKRDHRPYKTSLSDIEVTDFWREVLHAIEYATQADPGDGAGLQTALLKQLDELSEHCWERKYPTYFADVEDTAAQPKHWSSIRKGGQLNTSFIHVAIQLQLTDFLQYAIALKPVKLFDANEWRHEAAIRLLMATLYYDQFAKDISTSELKIVPQSLNISLIRQFLEQGADPNYKIENALMAYGNITGSYTVWETHLREPNRTTETWSEVSLLLLHAGANPTLVNSAIPGVPDEVVQLALQKTKAWKRKEGTRRKTHRFGAIFGAGRIRIPFRVKLAVK